MSSTKKSQYNCIYISLGQRLLGIQQWPDFMADTYPMFLYDRRSYVFTTLAREH